MVLKITYCIASGTLLNALWRHKWEGNSRKEDIRIYIAHSFYCTAKANTTL